MDLEFAIEEKTARFKRANSIGSSKSTLVIFTLSENDILNPMKNEFSYRFGSPHGGSQLNKNFQSHEGFVRVSCMNCCHGPFVSS